MALNLCLDVLSAIIHSGWNLIVEIRIMIYLKYFNNFFIQQGNYRERVMLMK